MQWLGVPTTCKYNHQPSTFTEWQKTFVGPHHQTKILGKNSQSTTKMTNQQQTYC